MYVLVDFVMHVTNRNGKKYTCICSRDSSWELGCYYPDIHRGSEVDLTRKEGIWYVRTLY